MFLGDPARLIMLRAARAVCCAQELNESTGPDSPVGLNLKIMVVGMTGTGATATAALIHHKCDLDAYSALSA